MSGVGEILAPAPALPPAWLVLVNPRRGLSTPAVFKARQGAFSAPRPLERAPVDAADLAREMALRTNDLAPPAVELLPVIADVLAVLARQADCLLSRMSGSGATCFGLFANEAAATRAAETLGHAHPGWWVAPAPIL
jgi:4-diphosphocytidyl-2-C-methyl-D-erythritol kinase